MKADKKLRKIIQEVISNAKTWHSETGTPHGKAESIVRNNWTMSLNTERSGEPI
jgi:hypothetical protein